MEARFGVAYSGTQQGQTLRPHGERKVQVFQCPNHYPTATVLKTSSEMNQIIAQLSQVITQNHEEQ